MSVSHRCTGGTIIGDTYYIWYSNIWPVQEIVIIMLSISEIKTYFSVYIDIAIIHGQWSSWSMWEKSCMCKSKAVLGKVEVHSSRDLIF